MDGALGLTVSKVTAGASTTTGSDSLEPGSDEFANTWAMSVVRSCTEAMVRIREELGKCGKAGTELGIRGNANLHSSRVSEQGLGLILLYTAAKYLMKGVGRIGGVTGTRLRQRTFGNP